MNLSSSMASLSLTSSLYLPSNRPAIQFVNPDVKYNCVKCNQILQEPVQMPCGHRMCLPCLQELSETEGFPCPSGEDDCGTITKVEVHPDYSVRKELSGMLIYCINRDSGCNKEIQWKFLKSHLESECQYTSIDCPYKCGILNLERSQMDSHIQQCPQRPQECKFKYMGCNFQGIKSVMGEHLVNSHLEHLDLLVLKIAELEVDNVSLKGNVETYLDQHEQLRNKLSETVAEITNLKAAFQKLTEDLKISEHQKLKMIATSNEKLLKLETKSTETEMQLREIEILKVRSQQVDTTIKQLQATDEGGARGGLSDDVRIQIISHERTVSDHDKQLLDMDLRMQCMETTNFQGVLIWKINDYHRRLQEAKSGKTLSLYSQPFYTSRYGYKMCARVYLNGDGTGRNKQISFFFVIMQGDYDDILPWPFKQKVTLMLLDQKNQNKPISDTFKPDPKSNSFHKPTSSMNVASGCPQFVEHETLEKDDLYLKNEILFFKIVVDTSDLLNP